MMIELVQGLHLSVQRRSLWKKRPVASGQTKRLMDRTARCFLTPSSPPTPHSSLLWGPTWSSHRPLRLSAAHCGPRCRALPPHLGSRPWLTTVFRLPFPLSSWYSSSCASGPVPVWQPCPHPPWLFSLALQGAPRGWDETTPEQGRPAARAPECPQVFCPQTRAGLSSPSFASAMITFLRAGMEVLGGELSPRPPPSHVQPLLDSPRLRQCWRGPHFAGTALTARSLPWAPCP